MTMFEMCIDYNAQAVSLMADGRHPEAVKTMKIALQCLKEEQSALLIQGAEPNAAGTTPALTPPTTGGSVSDADATVPPSAPESADDTQIHSVRLLTDDATNQLSPNNLFQLYPCAFVVNPDRVQEIPDSRLTAVLLYNFGLATHFAAMHKRDDSVLRQALSVYDKVIQYVHAALTAEEGQTDEGGEMIWLMLALACNSGHAHAHRLDFSNTRETLSWLLRLITIPVARLTVPVEDFGVFFENACTFLEGMKLSIAPAA